MYARRDIYSESKNGFSFFMIFLLVSWSIKISIVESEIKVTYFIVHLFI